MDRYFVRTAAVVFCAAWVAGCGTAGAADAPKAPSAPAAGGQDAAQNDLPATLDGEIARAHTLRIAGQYEEADRALSQLMLVDPDDVRVVGEYGKVLVQMNRPSEGLPFLKRAVELQANDWTIYSAMGVGYDQSGDHAQARAAYEHALALKPGAADVLNNYAVSRMMAGDYAGAQHLLAQAEATGAGDAKIANNIALLATMKGRGVPMAAAAQPAPVRTAPVQTSPLRAPRPASSAPRALASVMMQKVPVDPYAGPVASHKAPEHKLAKKAAHETRLAATHSAHKTAAEPAAPPPMLRTAADGR